MRKLLLLSFLLVLCANSVNFARFSETVCDGKQRPRVNAGLAGVVASVLSPFGALAGTVKEHIPLSPFIKQKNDARSQEGLLVGIPNLNVFNNTLKYQANYLLAFGGLWTPDQYTHQSNAPPGRGFFLIIVFMIIYVVLLSKSNLPWEISCLKRASLYPTRKYLGWVFYLLKGPLDFFLPFGKRICEGVKKGDMTSILEKFIGQVFNFKKLVAVLTVSCFIYTSVFAQVLQGAVENRRDDKRVEKMIGDYVVPAASGRITDSFVFPDAGSPVVLNIQDLHCHAEVQKNIAKILESLDEKYKLKKVYVEGASGRVDTSWLASISDEKTKKEVLDVLVRQGRLTGAEHYSVTSGKTGLLAGIEDERVYGENFRRLSRLTARSGDYAAALASMRDSLGAARKKYFNSKNIRFENLLSRNRENGIQARKYYAMLLKYPKKLKADRYGFGNLCPIDENDFVNIRLYVELAEDSEKLNYKRIGLEIQGLLALLKEKIPFKTFNRIIERTDGFKKLDELYACLMGMAREYRIDLSSNYPNLSKFFAYLEKSRKLDTAVLLAEEKKLISAVHAGLSETRPEFEVSFLSDFLAYLGDFLGNKLTAEDYRYFSGNYATFRSLWPKYADGAVLDGLAGDIKLADDFYKANIRRNACFLKNMDVPARGAAAGKGAVAVPESELSSLIKASGLIVVVTGGFHSDGLMKLLKARRISCVVVTPNITEDTKVSDALYAETAKLQAALAKASFALKLLSEYGPEARVRSLVSAEVRVEIGIAAEEEGLSVKEYAQKKLKDAAGGNADVETLSKNLEEFARKWNASVEGSKNPSIELLTITAGAGQEQLFTFRIKHPQGRSAVAVFAYDTRTAEFSLRDVTRKGSEAAGAQSGQALTTIDTQNKAAARWRNLSREQQEKIKQKLVELERSKGRELDVSDETKVIERYAELFVAPRAEAVELMWIAAASVFSKKRAEEMSKRFMARHRGGETLWRRAGLGVIVSETKLGAMAGAIAGAFVTLSMFPLIGGLAVVLAAVAAPAGALAGAYMLNVSKHYDVNLESEPGEALTKERQTGPEEPGPELRAKESVVPLDALMEYTDAENVARLFEVKSLNELPSDVTEIEAVLKSRLSGTLREYYASVIKHVYPGKEFSQKDEKTLDILVNHIIAVYASFIQSHNLKYIPEPEKQLRLAGLFRGDTDGKLSGDILSGLRSTMAGAMSGEKAFSTWAFICLFHDIGKCEEYFGATSKMHDISSGQLMRELGIMEKFGSAQGLSAKETGDIYWLIKTHARVGAIMPGAASLTAFSRILDSDEEFREYYADGGYVDLERIKTLMQWNLAFWALDSAGSGEKGFCSAVPYGYFDSLVSEFGKAAGSGKVSVARFRAMLEKNAKENFERRLGRYLGAWVQGSNDEEQRVKCASALKGLVASGEISKVDGELFREYFGSEDLLGHLDKITAKLVVNYKDYKTFMRALVLFIKAARSTALGGSVNQINSMGEDNVAPNHAEHDRYGGYLHKAMLNAKGIAQEGKRIYFVEGNGRMIKGLEVSKDFSGEPTMVIKISNPDAGFSALSVGFEEFLVAARIVDDVTGWQQVVKLSGISAAIVRKFTGAEKQFIVRGSEFVVERQKLQEAFSHQPSVISKDVEIRVSKSNEVFAKTPQGQVCGIPAFLTTESGKTVLYIHQGFLEALIAESDKLGAIFDSIHGPGGTKITLIERFAEEELAELTALGPRLPGGQASATVEDYKAYHENPETRHLPELTGLALKTARETTVTVPAPKILSKAKKTPPSDDIYITNLLKLRVVNRQYRERLGLPDMEPMFIATADLDDSDLDADTGALGPEKEMGRLPVSPEERDWDVHVNFPGNTVYLMSKVSNGSYGVTRLGWLDDGTPVAVKSVFLGSRSDADKMILEDARSAAVAEALGIGQKFHGICRDGYFGVSVVMGIIPGDFAAQFSEGPVNRVNPHIGLNTVKDLLETFSRIERSGRSVGGDFQYYVTLRGSIRVLDFGGGILEKRMDSTSLKGRELAKLLLYASDEVKDAALRHVRKEHPELFNAIIPIKDTSYLGPVKKLAARLNASGGSLVLPVNRPLVEQWKSEGKSDWWIAKEVAKLEFVDSLSPVRFYRRHYEGPGAYTGGKWRRRIGVAAITAFMWAAYAIIFVPTFGFAQGLAVNAARSANIYTHAIYNVIAKDHQLILRRASEKFISRIIKVTEHTAHSTFDETEVLTAGLSTCVAVAAKNIKTGERKMVHFLIQSQEKVREKWGEKNEDLKRKLFAEFFRDVRGSDWRAVIATSYPEGAEKSEGSIRASDIRDFLVNENNLDSLSVISDDEGKEKPFLKWLEFYRGEVKVIENRIGQASETRTYEILDNGRFALRHSKGGLSISTQRPDLETFKTSGNGGLPEPVRPSGALVMDKNLKYFRAAFEMIKEREMGWARIRGEEDEARIERQATKKAAREVARYIAEEELWSALTPVSFYLSHSNPKGKIIRAAGIAVMSTLMWGPILIGFVIGCLLFNGWNGVAAGIFQASVLLIAGIAFSRDFHEWWNTIFWGTSAQLTMDETAAPQTRGAGDIDESEKGLLRRDQAIGQLKRVVEALERRRAEGAGKVNGASGIYQRGAVLYLRGIPKDREVILVGDLHARLDNLEAILGHNGNLGKIKTGKAVLVILGDAVHREEHGYLADMNSSLRMMQYIYELILQAPENVYYLLGNHDTIEDVIDKSGIHQCRLWKERLVFYGGEDYLKLYAEFLVLSPVLAVGHAMAGAETDVPRQGLIANHAGPAASAPNLARIENTIFAGSSRDKLSFDIKKQMLWTRADRPGDKKAGHTYYGAMDVAKFRATVKEPSAHYVVSHSPQVWEDPQNPPSWHFEPLPGVFDHHVIFAGFPNDRENALGYASYLNGKLTMVDVPPSEVFEAEPEYIVLDEIKHAVPAVTQVSDERLIEDQKRNVKEAFSKLFSNLSEIFRDEAEPERWVAMINNLRENGGDLVTVRGLLAPLDENLPGFSESVAELVEMERALNGKNDYGLVLPVNRPLVEQWKADGKSDWWIARMVAEIEFKAALNPVKFFRDHYRGPGAYEGGRKRRIFGVLGITFFNYIFPVALTAAASMVSFGFFAFPVSMVLVLSVMSASVTVGAFAGMYFHAVYNIISGAPLTLPDPRMEMEQKIGYINGMLRKYPYGAITDAKERASDDALIARNVDIGFLWFMVFLSGETGKADIRGHFWRFEQRNGNIYKPEQMALAREYNGDLRVVRPKGAEQVFLVSTKLGVVLTVSEKPVFELLTPETAFGLKIPLSQMTFPVTKNAPVLFDSHRTHDGFYHFTKRLVEEGKIKKGMPLVVFDYHNDNPHKPEDIPPQRGIREGNWVSFLIKEGLVGPVYWVRPKHAPEVLTRYLGGYAKIVDDPADLPWADLSEGCLLSFDADYFNTRSTLNAAVRRPNEKELREEIGGIRELFESRGVNIPAIGLAVSPLYSHEYDFPIINAVIKDVFLGPVIGRAAQAVARAAGAAEQTTKETKIFERLSLLGSGEIAEAVKKDPEKFGFILDDPFLNDEEFWNDEAKVDEMLASKKAFNRYCGVEYLSTDSYNYFPGLRSTFKEVEKISKSIRDSYPGADTQFVFLGRGADMLYCGLKHELGLGGAGRCYLVDFSRRGPDCVELARKNPQAFARYIESLGIRKDGKLVIIDEYSTNREYFLYGIRDMLKSCGFRDVDAIDAGHDLARKETDLKARQSVQEAMLWYGTEYAAGRTFEIDPTGEKWSYVYHDYIRESNININKNGKYWGWLNRKAFYDYILGLKTKPTPEVGLVAGRIVPDSAAKLIAKAKAVPELGFSKNLYPIGIYVDKLKGKAHRFLHSGDISIKDLPEGYSTTSGFREQRPVGRLPNRIDQCPSVRVNFPDEDVFIVSKAGHGTTAFAKLGWFDDGTPVAVKVYMFDADKYRVLDARGAMTADALGIGPKFYGTESSASGEPSLVSDIVPGDFPVVAKERINTGTIDDLMEAVSRIESQGLRVRRTIQYLVTPSGRVQFIDFGEGVDRKDADGDWMTKAELLSELVIYAKDVEGLVRHIAKKYPELAAEMLQANRYAEITDALKKIKDEAAEKQARAAAFGEVALGPAVQGVAREAVRESRRIKTVLINVIAPDYSGKRQLPSAAETLAAELRKAKAPSDVEIIDMPEIYDQEMRRSSSSGLTREQILDNVIAKVVEKVNALSVDVVGLCMKWRTLDVSETTIGKIRKSLAVSPLFVLGNLIPTFAWERLLERPGLDGVIMVVGEGEDAMVEILEAVEANRDRYVLKSNFTELYGAIPNVVFAGKATVKCMRVISEKLPDEDEAREFFGKPKEESVLLESSRGCPHGVCTFCSVGKLYGPGGRDMSAWIPRPAAEVLKYIEKMAEKGFRRFYFIDSEFFGYTRTQEEFEETMARVEQIANGIMAINEKLGLEGGKALQISSFSARVDTIYRKGEDERNKRRLEVYKLLVRAGFKKAYLGIESGSREQLKRYGKGVSVEENARAMEILRQIGMSFEAGFIFFDPLATIEDLKENLDFVERTGLQRTQGDLFGPFRLQKSSPYVALARNNGLITGELDLESLSYPFRYKNAEVGRIQEVFRPWDDQFREVGRYLLATRRTDAGRITETDKEELDVFVLRLRAVEFEVLRNLVDNHESIDEISKEGISSSQSEKIRTLFDDIERWAVSRNARNIRGLRNSLETTREICGLKTDSTASHASEKEVKAAAFGEVALGPAVQGVARAAAGAADPRAQLEMLAGLLEKVRLGPECYPEGYTPAMAGRIPENLGKAFDTPYGSAVVLDAEKLSRDAGYIEFIESIRAEDSWDKIGAMLDGISVEEDGGVRKADVKKTKNQKDAKQLILVDEMYKRGLVRGRKPVTLLAHASQEWNIASALMSGGFAPIESFGIPAKGQPEKLKALFEEHFPGFDKLWSNVELRKFLAYHLLLHDIGKVSNGNPNHERLSAEILGNVFKEETLGLSAAERDILVLCVKYHSMIDKIHIDNSVASEFTSDVASVFVKNPEMEKDQLLEVMKAFAVFRVAERVISEHWGLIDGQAMKAQRASYEKAVEIISSYEAAGAIAIPGMAMAQNTPAGRKAGIESILRKDISKLNEEDLSVVMEAAEHFSYRELGKLAIKGAFSAGDLIDISVNLEALRLLVHSEEKAKTTVPAGYDAHAVARIIGNVGFTHDLNKAFAASGIVRCLEQMKMNGGESARVQAEKLIGTYDRQEVVLRAWRRALSASDLEKAEPQLIISLLHGLVAFLEGIESEKRRRIEFIKDNAHLVTEPGFVKMVEEVEALARISRVRLLEHARTLIEGMAGSEYEVTNIGDSIKQVAASHDKRFGFKVKLDLAEDTPNVRINSWMMRYVWNNLFTNAEEAVIGARMELGVISIETNNIKTEEGEFVEARFSDNGPGIEAGVLDRVFDGGFTTKTSERNFGQGLAFIRKTIEELGGTITVESRHISQFPDNHGTTFTIRIPAAKSASDAATSVISDNEVPSSGVSEAAGQALLIGGQAFSAADPRAQLEMLAQKALEAAGVVTDAGSVTAGFTPTVTIGRPAGRKSEIESIPSKDADEFAEKDFSAAMEAAKQAAAALKPLALRTAIAKAQGRIIGAPRPRNPLSKNKGSIYHITTALEAKVLEQAALLNRQGMNNIIVVPVGEVEGSLARVSKTAVDGREIGIYHARKAVNGAGVDVIYVDVPEGVKFGLCAHEAVRRLSEEESSIGQKALSFTPLVIVAGAEEFAAADAPMSSSTAYVVEKDGSVEWKKAAKAHKLAESIYEYGTKEAVRLYEEAVILKDGENAAKGTDLILSVPSKTVASNISLFNEMAAKLGIGNIRLTDAVSTDREMLRRIISGLKGANGNIRVLCGFKAKDFFQLKDIGTKAVGLLNIFDGVEIDLSGFGASDQDGIVKMLNEVAKWKPRALITVVLPESVDAGALARRLAANVTVTQVFGRADESGARCVKFTVANGFDDLLRVLETIGKTDGGMFEIAFEDGAAINTSMLARIITGMKDALVEDAGTLYEIGLNYPAIDEALYARIREFFAEHGIRVDGADFEGAVAGKDTSKLLSGLTALFKGMKTSDSAVAGKFTDILLGASGTDETRQNAVTRAVALLQGAVEAVLVKNYLDSNRRTGFELDSDRKLFGRALWAVDSMEESDAKNAAGLAKAIRVLCITGNREKANKHYDRYLSLVSRPDRDNRMTVEPHKMVENLQLLKLLGRQIDVSWVPKDKLNRLKDAERVGLFNLDGELNDDIDMVLERGIKKADSIGADELLELVEAVVSYGGFTYEDTLAVLERAKLRFIEISKYDDPLSLAGLLRVLDLLSNERMKFEKKKREARVDMKAVADMLGAA